MTNTITALQALKLALPILERLKYQEDCAYGKNSSADRAKAFTEAYEAARAALAAPAPAPDAPSEFPFKEVRDIAETLDCGHAKEVHLRRAAVLLRMAYVAARASQPTPTAQDAEATVPTDAQIEAALDPNEFGGADEFCGQGEVVTMGELFRVVRHFATPAAHQAAPTAAQAVTGQADDAVLEAAIEASDGAWHDDEFRITGSELMALLRSVATPTAAQAAPARVPLTVPEISDACALIFQSQYPDTRGPGSYDVAVARAIEAAHGITPAVTTPKEQQS